MGSRARPAHLRLLSALVAGTFTVSGCVTTYVVPPSGLSAVAGLPEDQEAKLRTYEGYETVKGSTRVTLLAEGGTAALWTPNPNSSVGGSTTATQVPLSSLRSEAGTLVLSETGQTLALNSIWGAEFTKTDEGKTAGLVVGVILGAALMALLVAAVVAVNSCNNSLNQTFNH